ncbi:GNAT family N-acetyltransferase [Roseibium suaedae]|uniref:Protein N-acetyltransferase, RimJ/RimL family n=1 Tax=Roseibium suaedae TaxID=735517 RepID=A0A1M7MHT6_9HYPH|nr:GNAT family N-acetyltransferase [Roseibium suaedae]SHM90472.1 Protein N-acetyltransferase, RimJ/RimL family [Roseibium suaedae]
MHLETDRLILRDWQDGDRDPFAEMGQDPEVMRFFPSLLSRRESDALIDKAMSKQAADGFCFVPVEEKATGRFLGFTGLSRPSYPKSLPFDPCVEIGWRFARSAWGKGYASEAAREWLRFGFATLGLDEVVAFTTRTNLKSQAVMQRIGMITRPEDDFPHPMLASDHPLVEHVLYRLQKSSWSAAEPTPTR